MAIGIGLIAYSLTLPYYSNNSKPKLESDAFNQMMLNGRDLHKIDEIKSKYYQQVEKIKTKKTFYFDLGSGIAVATLVLFLFLLTYKVKRFSDFSSIKSFRKNFIYFTAIPVWLFMIPGTFWYYSFRAERGDYPMFSDSIAIPIMYSTITIFIGLLGLIPFLIIFSRGGIFPTYIFIKPQSSSVKTVLAEVFLGLLLLVNLFFLVGFVIGGDHVSIPVCLYFTYLIFVLRAGQINRSNNQFIASSNTNVTGS